MRGGCKCTSALLRFPLENPKSHLSKQSEKMKPASYTSIAFTPSWLVAAHVELARGGRMRMELYRVPLPAGCINDHSGIIEDYSKLKAALVGLAGLNWDLLGVGEVSIILPPFLCYHTVFSVPGHLKQASTDAILAEYPLELPGDRDSLIVAAHSHEPDQLQDRTVMLVAARQSVIADYVRLFAGYEWAIDVVTTGEVARFNRCALDRSRLKGEVALVCSCNDDHYEFSVWDRGVLVASNTRRRDRAERSEDDLNGVSLSSEVLAILRREDLSKRPITVVLLCGALRGCRKLQSEISEASEVSCLVSPDIESICKLETALTPEQANMSASGVFDDVTGVALKKQLNDLGCRGLRWFQ